MKELQAILTAYQEASAQNLACVLATVVQMEGSSYRQAGARMLVDEYGQMTGAISGGCLEGDALRKALHALHKGENKLVTYDTSDENDAIIGAQLGCNGVIHVLFEPINPDLPYNPIALLKELIDRKQNLVVVTLFHLNKSFPQLGTKCLISHEGIQAGDLNDEELHHQLVQDCLEALRLQNNHYGQYENHIALLNFNAPPPSLILVGAGNDAQVLAKMAIELGWSVVVADGRASHVNAHRFTSPCQLVLSEPQEVLQHVDVTERTFFVLMSHNYPYDLAVVKMLLSHTQIPYIGLLGPKKKFHRMLSELKADGMDLSDEKLSTIYSPVGLSLGAETPAEIALAILAEIQMVLTNSSGMMLRDKQGPIHDKVIQTTNLKAT